MSGEKRKRPRYMHAACCCFKQILEAAFDKTVADIVTYRQSYKPFKSSEQDILSTAEEVRMNL